jgi:hypothetical protein
MFAVLGRGLKTAASVDVDRAAFDVASGGYTAVVSADTWFWRFMIALVGPELDNSPDASRNSRNPAADPAKNRSTICVLQEIPNAGKQNRALRAYCSRGEPDRLPRADCEGSLALAQDVRAAVS